MRKMIIYRTTMYLLLSLMLVSCKDSDSTPASIDKPKLPVTINDAGEFILTNLSTGKRIIEDNMKIIPGDTIDVQFIPKEEYKNKNFTITYNGEEFKNSFVVFGSRSASTISISSEGSDIIQIKDKEIMTFAASYQSEDTLCNVTQTNIVNYYEESTVVDYNLGVMADLLEFVTPEVSYYDETGTLRTARPFENKEIKRDNLTYKDDDMSFDYSWFLSARYTLWDKDYNVTLRFIKKGDKDLTKDSYDFDCYFCPSKSYSFNKSKQISSTTFMSITIDINIGNKGESIKDEDGKIKKQYVDEYIDKLAETPISIKLHINKEGKVNTIL